MKTRIQRIISIILIILTLISAVSVLIPGYAIFAEEQNPLDAVRNRLEEAGITDISVDNISIGPLWLPASSADRSDILALKLLAMGSARNAEDTEKLFRTSGFEVLEQVNYDKELSDPAHTCAFTIGKGKVTKGLMLSDALLVSIRGTSGGEWYSNFDFCPSRSEDAVVSENFLYAAAEVFPVLKKYTDQYKNAQIILCGHSRGAACANLLGLLVNECLDPADIYVYTFATPRTIRKESLSAYSENIFNYINTADIVPMLPFESWGFERAGTDIYLESEETSLAADEERYIDSLSLLAPSITSYYYDRHAPDRKGLSETGITSFETMLLITNTLIEAADKMRSGAAETPDSLSDFPGQISEESDMHVLMEILDEISANGFEKGTAILLQHLPTAYLALMGNNNH